MNEKHTISEFQKSLARQLMERFNDRFPILGQPFLLDRSYVRQFETRALKNHGQNVEQLASRGGLSWYEVYCLIENLDLYDNRHMHSSATFYEGYVKRKYKQWLDQQYEFDGR